MASIWDTFIPQGDRPDTRARAPQTDMFGREIPKEEPQYAAGDPPKISPEAQAAWQQYSTWLAEDARDREREVAREKARMAASGMRPGTGDWERRIGEIEKRFDEQGKALREGPTFELLQEEMRNAMLGPAAGGSGTSGPLKRVALGVFAPEISKGIEAKARLADDPAAVEEFYRNRFGFGTARAEGPSRAAASASGRRPGTGLWGEVDNTIRW